MQRFVKDESGVLAPFVLVLMFIMMVIGGIAVDVMRFEWRRVMVQNTLDRGTLAAANLTHTLAVEGQFNSPEELIAAQKAHVRKIVQSYFTVAGLDENLADVELDIGLNFRTVDATAKVLSKNYFMSFFDIDYLRASPVSRAEHRRLKVEVVLVVDISRSMHLNITRINNLKRAASHFIDQMLPPGTEELISISLVPYNSQVNLGPEIFDQFNATHRHQTPRMFCLDLPDSVFNMPVVPREMPLAQMPFAELTPLWPDPTSTIYSDYTTKGTEARGLYTNISCSPIAENYVFAHSSDPAALKARIAALVPIGGTAINMGMRWGTTLLDPSSRQIMSTLATRGMVRQSFATRPAAYDDPETIKAVVLMTDGANIETASMGDPSLFTGPSPVFVSNTDKKYSIFQPDRLNRASTRCKPFWVAHVQAPGAVYPRGDWQARAWNGSTPPANLCYDGTAALGNYAVTGAKRLNMDEVWGAIPVNWGAWYLFARATEGTGATSALAIPPYFNAWMKKLLRIIPKSTMDAQTTSLCDMAKSNNIMVYTIAFEADPDGQSLLRDCASSPKNQFYFQVASDNSGLEISRAFRAIASTLNKLRLTQ